MKIGIIGGSGLDNPDILKDKFEKDVHTPYGKPASSLTCGKIGGIDVVILARHGRKHEVYPTAVPNQANIWALKQEGCTHIIAATAVGSLKEEIKPGHLVLLDQFIDRTTQRNQTFYDKAGKICHIPMGDPFCEKIRTKLIETAKELNLNFHPKGTVVTIEGPRFSSRAESNMYRQFGCDVINMSTVPEVVLAREAGLCYAAIAMSTDYDCWKTDEAHVTHTMVLETMKKNANNVIDLLIHTIPKITDEVCSCPEHVKTSVFGHE